MHRGRTANVVLGGDGAELGEDGEEAAAPRAGGDGDKAAALRAVEDGDKAPHRSSRWRR